MRSVASVKLPKSEAEKVIVALQRLWKTVKKGGRAEKNGIIHQAGSLKEFPCLSALTG